MTTWTKRIATVLSATLAVTLLLGTLAGAATTRLVDDDGVQCPEAGYTSINAAVAASVNGDRIRVCPGTYAEQVIVDRGVSLIGLPGSGGRPVVRPSTLPVASPSLIGSGVVQAAIIVDRANASVRDLDIDLGGVTMPACAPMAGVFDRAGSGVVRDMEIRGARVSGDPGCSSGVGLYVESGQIGDNNGQPVYGVAKVTARFMSFTDNQKGGVVARGRFTVMKVRDSVFVGDGAAAGVPQNGIEISAEARSRVGALTFAGFRSPLPDRVGTGLLVYDTSRVVGRELIVDDTDVGIFAYGRQVKVLSSQIRGPASDGFILLGDRNLMSGNQVDGVDVSGVFIDGSGNRIRGGRLSNMPVGIWFFGGDDNHTSGVTFSNVLIPGQNVAGGPRTMSPTWAMPFALGCQDAASCNDGLPCTMDSCDVLAGTCSSVAGCNDGNPCTSDVCGATGCVYTPLTGTPCADGDLCTASESCSAGTCVGQPVVCDDANECTDDICLSHTGCIFAPRDCSDGDECTRDACQPGVGCVSTAITCVDGSLCTTDGCDPAVGCTYVPIGCDDGNACTGDTCHPLLGCQTPPIVCNDENICTDDSCDPATGCIFAPNTLTCDDVNPCTENDVCGGGTCAGTLISCDDADACTADACDPATGCGHTAIDCDDTDPCTTDTCDSAIGCQNAACDDANLCTNDVCDTGVGCTFPAVDCNDADLCTIDICFPSVGCQYTAVNCDAGNACTSASCDPV